MEYYKINCKECNKKTIHKVYLIRRNRGIKLQCLRCGHIKKRYYKNLEDKKIKGVLKRNTM